MSELKDGNYAIVVDINPSIADWGSIGSIPIPFKLYEIVTVRKIFKNVGGRGIDSVEVIRPDGTYHGYYTSCIFKPITKCLKDFIGWRLQALRSYPNGGTSVTAGDIGEIVNPNNADFGIMKYYFEYEPYLYDLLPPSEMYDAPERREDIKGVSLTGRYVKALETNVASTGCKKGEYFLIRDDEARRADYISDYLSKVTYTLYAALRHERNSLELMPVGFVPEEISNFGRYLKVEKDKQELAEKKVKEKKLEQERLEEKEVEEKRPSTPAMPEFEKDTFVTALPGAPYTVTKEGYVGKVTDPHYSHTLMAIVGPNGSEFNVAKRHFRTAEYQEVKKYLEKRKEIEGLKEELKSEAAYSTHIAPKEAHPKECAKPVIKRKRLELLPEIEVKKRLII